MTPPGTYGSNASWEELCDLVSDSMVVIDDSGRVSYLNAAAVRLLGWPAHDARGESAGLILRLFEADGQVVDVGALPSTSQPASPLFLMGRDGTTRRASCRRFNLMHVPGQTVWIIHADELNQPADVSRDLEAESVNPQMLESPAFTRELGHRAGDASYWLFEVQIEWLHVIQGTMGNEAVETLARQVALLLRARLRYQGELVARVDQATFGLLLNTPSRQEAQALANALHQELSAIRFQWRGQAMEVRFCIGAASLFQGAEQPTPQYGAHLACRIAQRKGGVFLFDPESAELKLQQMEWSTVGSLQSALREERVELYYQPIVCLEDGSGGPGDRYELLCRLLDERGEAMPPTSIVAVAEQHHLIRGLDTLVFRTALRSLERLYGTPACRTLSHASVNLSAASLGNADLLAFILEEFARTRVDPRTVCFEITESTSISDFEQARSFISRLRSLGCTFALDDFGSGQSSFSYLMRLGTVDYIKIDGSFVQDVCQNPVTGEMILSMVNIARQMKMKTIAEFVDSPLILAKLKSLGVDYAQGNLFGAARPLSHLMKVLPG